MPKSNFTIIIPAAGLSKRFNQGQKCLAELRHGETIIGRQLFLLQQQFPEAKIILVGGYEYEKMYASRPKNVTFIVNESFETTNVVHSLNLGLMATDSKKILVVYGDLVYNNKFLRTLQLNTSCLITEERGLFNNSEVGVLSEDGAAVNLSYGICPKWCHIAYFTKHELKLLRKYCAVEGHKRYFGYEVLNMITENNGVFRVDEAEGSICEVDRIEDLEKARKIR